MAEGSGSKGKAFIVTDDRDGSKRMIGFEQFSNFEETCKQKFGYSKEEQVIFETDDGEHVVVDETAFAYCENKTKLRIRKDPAADIKLGFLQESPGTTLLHNQNQNKEKEKFASKDDVDKEDVTVKTFLVTDKQSGKCCEVIFTCFADFEKECKSTFNYESGDDIAFTLENENIELEEDSFRMYPSGTKVLIIPKLCSGSDMVDEELQEQSDHDNSWSSPEIENLTTGADYIRSELSRRGIDNLEDILQESMKIPLAALSICVTGGSGTGKSQLINVMRGLSRGDDGYAEVGITETTMECTPYVHPHHENITLWDVPGVGTMNFPKDKYLSKIDFERYDFYIICSASRFTENDSWLYNEVKKQKKRCYYVRTKIDQDIRNSEYTFGRGFDRDKVMENIRQECKKNLPGDCPVFLINGYNKCQFDFLKLLNAIVMDASPEHQRSFVHGLELVSMEIIEKKAAFLKGEVWKVAILPTLGLRVSKSYACFIQEIISEYQQHFELTDSHIEKYSRMASVPVSDFKREANLKVNFYRISAMVANVCATRLMIGAHKNKFSTIVPVLAISVNVSMSYWKIGNMLAELIDDMKEDAIRIFRLVLRKQSCID